MLDSSKLKEFTDNNFEFKENGGKSSEILKNAVGKGEIAHYEQFLFFPRCFLKTCLHTRKNKGIFVKRLSGFKFSGIKVLIQQHDSNCEVNVVDEFNNIEHR